MSTAEPTRRYGFFLHTFISAWFTDSLPEYTHTSKNVESICPPELLCLVLQFAVGRDGVKALLPFTQINSRWRHTALGDPSLWTIIRLEQMTPRLLDMTLAHAGNQLFEVYVDQYYRLDRFARLWKLVDRIEALYFIIGFGFLHDFLSSLGPAPNLKVLCLRPMMYMIWEWTPVVDLPAEMFSGCFPSLRNLSLPNADTWPIGLFKRLTSFECGDLGYRPIPPVRVLDILRESPSIEFIRLVGSCTIPPGFEPPAIPLPLLKECTLNGPGTATLIRFMTIPATAHVSLTKLYIDDEAEFPRFEDFSAAPGLHVLDEVSTVSVYADNYKIRFRAENTNGGVLEAMVDELGGLWGELTVFIILLKDALLCTRTRPGFKTTKVLKLDLWRGRSREEEEAGYFKLEIMHCIQCVPEVEEIYLLDLPWPELSFVLLFLGHDPNTQDSPPNVTRLHIVSHPIPSPRRLLLRLDELLTKRERRGTPFHSITVEVKCAMLIPAADHCAFLASWERLVEGDVMLKYRKWPCRSRRKTGDKGEDKGESDEKDRNDEDDEDGCCVGWDGWPEEWPETVEEMKKG